MKIVVILISMYINVVYAENIVTSDALIDEFSIQFKLKNWVKAERLAMKLNNSNPKKYFLLAMLYGTKENPKHDKTKTVQYYEMAMKAKDLVAQEILVWVYLIQQEPEYSNYERGVKLAKDLLPKYKQLIAKGEDTDGGLHRALGRFYLFGVGVKKDLNVAVAYYEGAAKLGDKKSIKLVPYIYKLIDKIKKIKEKE